MSKKLDPIYIVRFIREAITHDSIKEGFSISNNSTGQNYGTSFSIGFATVGSGNEVSVPGLPVYLIRGESELQDKIQSEADAGGYKGCIVSEMDPTTLNELQVGINLAFNNNPLGTPFADVFIRDNGDIVLTDPGNTMQAIKNLFDGEKDTLPRGITPEMFIRKMPRFAEKQYMIRVFDIGERENIQILLIN